jgi:hypothetical protein
MSETKLVFHHCLNTKGGFVSGVKMVPVLNQVNNTAVGSNSMIKTMSVEINKLQKIPGHCGDTHV